MPEYLRALLVILFLATVVLAAAAPSACALAMPAEDFRRRRNLWLALTLVAFLAHNFWLFTAVSAALMLWSGRQESKRLSLFFFLVLALPSLGNTIPGFGVINQLFTLNYIRLLALTILLPAVIGQSRPGGHAGRALALPDALLGAYIFFDLAHQLALDTLTNTLRYAFYAGVDIVLPYYVARRSLRDLPAFRHALMSFAVASLVVAAIAAFEYAKKWLLYSSLDEALGIAWGYGGYLMRDNSLRAIATTGQPIALGYVMVVACCIFQFLAKSVPNRLAWLAGQALLLVGLTVPLSRGPWVGAAVAVLVFAATGRRPLQSLLKLGLLGAAGFVILLASPFAERVVDLLPFVGKVGAANIAYRQQLLEVSVELIKLNPFFGSYQFLDTLEGLRQGEGIVDIVNTYLGIVLTNGLVGLGLFVSFFLAVALRVYLAMRTLSAGEDELLLLGQSWLAALAAILTTIFTVSSITVIPVIYWSFAGLGMAYAHLLEQRLARRLEASPQLRPEPSH